MRVGGRPASSPESGEASGERGSVPATQRSTALGINSTCTIGSEKRYSVSDWPVNARSVHGESTTAADGKGEPSSRKRIILASASPPPDESPTNATLHGSAPWAMSQR